MSTFADKNTIFAYGPPGWGKTFLIQALMGEMRNPIICIDPGFQEWHDPAQRSFMEAEGLREYLVRCADRGAYPDPVLSVEEHAGPATLRFLWKAQVGCTVIVDEIDSYAPNSGKTNDALRLMLKKGRHVQGKDSEASISVVGACHAAQEVDRCVARFGAHLAFQQEEPNAVERAHEYLHPYVDVRKLGKYEFTVSKKAGPIGFLPDYGPHVHKYDPGAHRIERVGTFSQSGELNYQ